VEHHKLIACCFVVKIGKSGSLRNNRSRDVIAFFKNNCSVNSQPASVSFAGIDFSFGIIDKLFINIFIITYTEIKFIADQDFKSERTAFRLVTVCCRKENTPASVKNPSILLITSIVDTSIEFMKKCDII